MIADANKKRNESLFYFHLDGVDNYRLESIWLDQIISMEKICWWKK